MSTSFSGHLHLTAARRDDGRTVIARQSFRAPFHISKPYWDGHVLQVQVVNPTAGVLSGDELELNIEVESGAALLVTTPAATRAFMMRNGSAACRQTFVVRADGWLEYAPEALCPHRDCDYAQRTCLEVAAGAEVFYTDRLAPGRVGRGESWAWRSLQLTLDVRFAGEPILRERLDAAGAELGRWAAFHGTPDAWLGTVVVFSERVPADGVFPTDEIRALHGDGCWVGVTRLRRAGWIVRVLAPGGQQLRDLMARLRRLLAEQWPHLRSDPRKL